MSGHNRRFPVFHPNDLVEGGEGGEAVGKEENDAVSLQGPEAGEDDGFGAGVQGGQGIVQNQQGPFVIKQSRQGDSGLLAAGESGKVEISCSISTACSTGKIFPSCPS